MIFSVGASAFSPSAMGRMHRQNSPKSKSKVKSTSRLPKRASGSVNQRGQAAPIQAFHPDATPAIPPASSSSASLFRQSSFISLPVCPPPAFPSLDPLSRAKVSEVAAMMRHDYQAAYGDIKQQMKTLFAPQGQLVGRVKELSSLTDKLQRLAKEEKQPFICAPWGVARVNDGIGFRLVLPTGSQAEVNAVLAKLTEATQTGALQILGINNYHGQNIFPYGSQDTITQLVKTAEAGFYPDAVEMRHGDASAVKASGYTALQLRLRVGVHPFPIELQIRGPMVNQVAEWEHTVYDLLQQKKPEFQIPRSAQQRHRSKWMRAVNSFSLEEKALYLNYLNQLYAWARLWELRELGERDMPVPGLPAKLSEKQHDLPQFKISPPLGRPAA